MNGFWNGISLSGWRSRSQSLGLCLLSNGVPTPLEMNSFEYCCLSDPHFMTFRSVQFILFFLEVDPWPFLCVPVACVHIFVHMHILLLAMVHIIQYCFFFNLYIYIYRFRFTLCIMYISVIWYNHTFAYRLTCKLQCVHVRAFFAHPFPISSARFIVNAANLIAPVIEKTEVLGYDWVFWLQRTTPWLGLRGRLATSASSRFFMFLQKYVGASNWDIYIYVCVCIYIYMLALKLQSEYIEVGRFHSTSISRI